MSAMTSLRNRLLRLSGNEPCPCQSEQGVDSDFCEFEFYFRPVCVPEGAGGTAGVNLGDDIQVDDGATVDAGEVFRTKFPFQS